MIRRFCDQCDSELNERNSLASKVPGERISASIGHLSVEVLVSQNGVGNSGDYCKYCVLDALYKIDDRPAWQPPSDA